MAAAILVLMGLPGSGKTTLAKNLAKNLNSEQYKLSIVTYDEVVSLDEQKKLAQGGEKLWKSERKKILKNVDDLLANKLQSEKLLVIIDDNNYYSSMRYEYFQLARQHQAGFCQVHVDVPVGAAIAANKARCVGQRVPDEVIERMATRLEPPDPLGNKWEQFSYTVSSADRGTNTDIFEAVIGVAFDNPVEPVASNEATKSESRAQCLASTVHQVDKHLRRILHRKIQDWKKLHNGRDVEIQVKKLNSAKNEILDDFRTGAAGLPVQNNNSNVDAVIEELARELFEAKLAK